ncbi:MAG: VOC family protein [Herbinix sp.]|nr:VOC family protein [Herbinix sp.]
MEIYDYITGLQHIGIPTNDIEATKAFYLSLGFELAFETLNEAADEKVSFLKNHNVIIETYENKKACKINGAIDHICLNVTDIEKVFKIIIKGNYEMLNNEILYLPFWEKGVRFFTILGPNKEKVEFSQMM